MCEAKDDCGCAGVHATVDLLTKGLHDVGACGHAVTIARKIVFVRGQVVENQRSVQRTARRDRTTSFLFVLADFFLTWSRWCIDCFVDGENTRIVIMLMEAVIQ